MFVESTIQYEGGIQDQLVVIQQKIKNEIEEAQVYFEITKIDSDLRITLKQQEYLCRLSENIEISILFNYDYPKSNPKYFVQQKFQKSPLINEETWEIKIQNEDTILKTLNKIIIEFTQNPPLLDTWIQQQIEKSSQLFPIPLNNLNIMQIQNQQDLLQIIKTKANNNQVIQSKVQQNYDEIENLKQDLKIVYHKFQQQQQNAKKLNDECSIILNKFSNYELTSVLKDKQGKLDKIKESFYEIQLQDQQNEKEKFYNSFLNNRIEFHKFNSIFTIFKQNSDQQSQIN